MCYFLPNSKDIFDCSVTVKNCGCENTVTVIYFSTMKSFFTNYFNEIKKKPDLGDHLSIKVRRCLDLSGSIMFAFKLYLT